MKGEVPHQFQETLQGLVRGMNGEVRGYGSGDGQNSITNLVMDEAEPHMYAE